jgi:phosphoglycerol transferase MdoB-like AlkP superfamily enzyme
MDPTIVKLAAAGILGAHGIGHVLGWMPALGITRFEGVSSRSWLLTAVVGDGGARLAAAALFLLPTAGFVLAAAGLLTGQAWWRQVAVVSAAVSLAGTALYPNAFTSGSTVGSVVVNLVVLYGILVAGWGAETAAI